MTDTLAPPFNRIFSDPAEAETAFELLRQTALTLGIDSPYHPRLAVTLSARTLHLDFGGGLVLGFQSPQKVTLALLNEEVQGLGNQDLQGFRNLAGLNKKDEPEVSNYELPRPLISPMSPELAQVYHHTLNFMAQKFQTWERSAYWKAHKPDVAEAIFDPMKRARLFAEGLPTEELIYERQFTAFNNVAEEEEVYQVNRNIAVTPLETSTLLAKPFSDIFIDRAEAEWAFDFLAQTFKLLGINSPDDPRFSLTLPKNKNVLRLNFGRWEIFNFYGKGTHRINLAFLEKQIPVDSNIIKAWTFKPETDSEPIISVYKLLVSEVSSMNSHVEQIYWQSFQYIGQKFSDRKGNTWRKFNQNEIVEAVFDVNKRQNLLTYGLNPMSLLTLPEIEPEKLAKPFSDIFIDRAEAEWAFDFLEQTFKLLKITNLNDLRFSLTLPKGKNILRLNFGNWLVVDFRSPNLYEYRTKVALFKHKVTQVDNEFVKGRIFVNKGDNIEVQLFGLKVSRLEHTSDNIQQLYKETMLYAALKFQNWKGTPYRSSHYPQIAEAVFDLNKRKHLLDNGFIDPDMTDEILESKPELETNPPYTLDQLMADTYMERATLDQWLRALERKKQIVLYGPPGTGKTFLARQLARHLISENNGHMALVQFHPAYSYEDFMQGLRPHINEAGQLSYVLQPGRFMTFCEQARQSADIHVMIIDEINRANLAQVFGELMYLLEYRDQAIPLAAGGELFRIPENIYLIGTMNTADRSIALVDHALRRRFAFIHVPPNMAVLHGYQAEKGYNADSLIHVLEQLNAAIDDRDHVLGVSFFLVDDLATHLPDIWQLEIEPYLEEYFFNRPDEVAKFRWAEIKKEVKIGQD